MGPMLGRLTPLKNPSSGQEFPDDWMREVSCLKAIGADCLEWIITDAENNPLYDADLTSYPIASINLHTLILRKLSFNELEKICFHAVRQGIFKLVLPMMDASSIQSRDWIKVYKELSQKYPPLSFSFETELRASEIMADISSSNSFFITYDTGNATSYNFDHSKEIEIFNNKINNVHLKDRIASGGASVEPFTGDTDFKLIFNKLKNINYHGNLILESFRGVVGEEVNTVSRYMKKFKCLI